MKRPASAWPDSWTLAEREEYKRAYLAGEPVLLTTDRHAEGTCTICDILRELIREAIDEEPST